MSNSTTLSPDELFRHFQDCRKHLRSPDKWKAEMKFLRELFGFYQPPKKLTAENIDEENEKLVKATSRLSLLNEVLLLTLLLILLILGGSR